MIECWECKNNKTQKSENKKLKIEYRCRLSYTQLYMAEHENLGHKCTEFEKME